MTFKQPALVNSPTSPVWKKPSESAPQKDAASHRAIMPADCWKRLTVGSAGRAAELIQQGSPELAARKPCKAANLAVQVCFAYL